MKAAQLIQYGGPESISINEVSNLTVTDNTVLIEVYAASVNPFDYKIQYGYMKEMIPLELPITLGGDLAGIITAVGDQVANFKVGDAVFGQAIAVAGNSGSFAEYARTKPSNIALKPMGIPFAEAAALPLVGVSAIQALYDHMSLQAEQKILIHGGAGGIGTMAIQIAKHIGAYVATTVSSDDIEYVKSLGADEVINYKEKYFEELLSEYDAVYDTVGGETTHRSLGILKPGGILVSMVQPVEEKLAHEKSVTTIMQSTQITTQRLEKLATLVQQEIVNIHIEKTFSLTDTAKALDYLKQTPPRGKVVIEIKE